MIGESGRKFDPQPPGAAAEEEVSWQIPAGGAGGTIQHGHSLGEDGRRDIRDLAGAEPAGENGVTEDGWKSDHFGNAQLFLTDPRHGGFPEEGACGLRPRRSAADGRGRRALENGVQEGQNFKAQAVADDVRDCVGDVFAEGPTTLRGGLLDFAFG